MKETGDQCEREEAWTLQLMLTVLWISLDKRAGASSLIPLQQNLSGEMLLSDFKTDCGNRRECCCFYYMVVVFSNDSSCIWLQSLCFEMIAIVPFSLQDHSVEMKTCLCCVTRAISSSKWENLEYYLNWISLIKKSCFGKHFLFWVLLS